MTETAKERGAQAQAPQPGEAGDAVSDWWRTEIIDMAPGAIRLRGRPIEEMIGRMSFAQVIWLMLRGEAPTPARAALFEAALAAAVDHGPQAPSIAAARMAVSCGLGLNGAMATAVNMLGDVHGGAGEQAIEFYDAVLAAAGAGGDLRAAAAEAIAAHKARGAFIPGFGHRFHKPSDPRAPRLLALVDRAAEQGVVSGRYAAVGRAVEATLSQQSRGGAVPMNIDGATAVVYAELGFAAPLARGLFCLSRSVGALAHAWEQMGRGERNKGPTPPEYRWTYDGPNPIREDGSGQGRKP